MKICLKHGGQIATHRCLVCRKPLCPKCLELFGYVCSPLCRAKAEAQRIAVPVYAGQKTVAEARSWRKIGAISAAIAGVVALAIGFWIWYAWVGAVPRQVFSVRFTERAYSGQSRLVRNDQIVFLRGGALSRYDIKTNQEIWSCSVIDQRQIAAAVARQTKAMQAVIKQANDQAWENVPPMPSREELTQLLTRLAAAVLQLHVYGQNIWVIAPDKLTRYDWATGKVLQEIVRPGGSGGLVYQGDELLLAGVSVTGQEIVTRVNLTSGQARTEEIGQPVKSAVLLAQSPPGTNPVASMGTAGHAATAGLPVGRPGADAGNPLDPAKVAEQAQRLSLPAKIALPALLANTLNQERIMAELNDQQRQRPRQAAAQPGPAERFSLIPGNHGFVRFSVRLLEPRFVARQAMKEAPQKSALDGNLTITKTADVANETLNEIQRLRGGDTVTEDESRYQATLHRPDTPEAPDWTGEVVGLPALFPLKTATVLAAGKTIIVFDKLNNKRWQAELSYRLEGSAGVGNEENPPYGEGPCVERGETLFVFDQVVLTAFDLATGNVRWRLPTVGVVGLFFDDRGMLYVNTTTASPENVRYSRQIDITQKTANLILKVDPQAGKILWRVESGGLVTYVSGKFIYTVQSFDPGDDYAQNDLTVALQKPPLLRIRRLSPRDGHALWEHVQARAPLDVHFSENSIELVFKKEVQVLRFFSL